MSQASAQSQNLGRIIPAEKVRIVEPLPEIATVPQPTALATAVESTTPHETEVVLLRDGERVQTIVIKCTCGQVTTLDCEY